MSLLEVAPGIGILLLILLGLAVAVAMIAVTRWSRRNPDPLHDIEDPETGISEAEWSRGIK